MEYFDKDGNKIEGLVTQEELSQKITEAIDAAKLEFEKNKESDGDKDQGKDPKEGNDADDVVEKVKAALESLGISKEKIDTISNNQTSGFLSKYKNLIDEDKKEEFQNRYNSLQGYGETPEEIEKRAQDAFLLTTGARFSDEGLNMQNLGHSTGNKANVNDKKEMSDLDKSISNVLGNSDDDIKKYSS